MGYEAVSYDKRIKENIRNYTLSNLYDMEMIKKYFLNLAEMLEINILLTNRHGEKEIVIGDSFLGFHPNTAEEPGRKIRIQNHTVGHLYIKELGSGGDEQLLNDMIDSTLELLMQLGREGYLHRESSIYVEELEKQLEDKRRVSSQNEREDILTGVYNKIYFESRMNIIDRSLVVPVAAINVNINDWKFVYDNFGVEKSDNLIQIVASIVKREAKREYIIGRIDGDVFAVLIPMAEDGEAEDYCKRVQEACMAYEEDEVLAPSVAVGIVYKTNVEEHLLDKISDAEYEMFDNKLYIKSSPGYQERLKKGLKI